MKKIMRLLANHRKMFVCLLAVLFISELLFIDRSGTTTYTISTTAVYSGEEIAHWTAKQADDFFSPEVKGYFFPVQTARPEFTGLGAARNGIKFYRLTYQTLDTDGNRILASGLLAIPDTEQTQFSLISYQHGTILDNHDSPSSLDRNDEAKTAAAIFAGRGYAVAIPDYIGIGVAAGFHPYLHAASEASASADFLLAVRAFAQSKGIKFDRRLCLVGLSQGGQATMALERLLESDPGKYGFEVAASAPISGPYEFNSVFQNWLRNPQQITSPVTVRMLTSYNRSYHLALDWKTVFRQPYASAVDSMFDGRFTIIKIQILPLRLQDLFTEDFLQQMIAGKGTLYEKIQDNAVFSKWTPRAPVRFYHGKADTVIPYATSEQAYKLLKQRGAKVQLVKIGDDVGHHDAMFPACVSAKKWFDATLSQTLR